MGERAEGEAEILVQRLGPVLVVVALVQALVVLRVVRCAIGREVASERSGQSDGA